MILEFIFYQWPALIWTALGLFGMRWCMKLLNRWIPGFRHYKQTGRTDEAEYAWSRMLKSSILTFTELVVVGIGTVILLGPVGQGNAQNFRGYVVVVGLLIVGAGQTGLAYLMNREDKQ